MLRGSAAVKGGARFEVDEEAKCIVTTLSVASAALVGRALREARKWIQLVGANVGTMRLNYAR